MTTTNKDMERAKELALVLADWHVETTKERYFKITQDGVDSIASLIAQVRAETLNDIVKLLQSVLLVSSHKDGIDINKIQTTTQIISIIEAMIPQAQEDKEHE